MLREMNSFLPLVSSQDTMINMYTAGCGDFKKENKTIGVIDKMELIWIMKVTSLNLLEDFGVAGNSMSSEIEIWKGLISLEKVEKCD